MKYDERKMMGLCIACGSIAAACGYLSILHITNGIPKFEWLLAAIPFGLASYFAFKRAGYYRELKKLMENWGKGSDRKRNFDAIGELYKNASVCDGDRFNIDDQTWEDLNMDIIYSRVDSTISIPGEQVLYGMLRTPGLNDEFLSARKKIINLFCKDKDIREEIQSRLIAIKRRRNSSCVSLLWGELPEKSGMKFVYTFMYLAAWASLISIVFLGFKGLVLLVFPVFAINSMIGYKGKQNIFAYLSSIRYLGSLIRTAGKIGNCKNKELEEYTKFLNEAASECGGIIRKTGSINPDNTDVFYEYFDIFFLTGLRMFYSVLGDIKSHREKLQQIYIKVGELDAMLSAASYRAGLKSWCEPVLERGSNSLNVQDMVHPLLKEPVSNSISIKGEGIIITGSNMSGKSTFLRTVGVNALFAQTICTCLASSYIGGYFMIMTSISRNDNIMGGKSYYLAEAEALLRIIKACRSSMPVMCIIDEIFRGTNSLERVSASAEIMDYLVSHNSIVIVATHDVELTEMVGKLYRCCYFSERVGENGLDFDYKIKEGISNTRNATKLMGYLGYPEKIVNGTSMRVAEALKGRQA